MEDHGRQDATSTWRLRGSRGRVCITVRNWQRFLCLAHSASILSLTYEERRD